MVKESIVSCVEAPISVPPGVRLARKPFSFGSARAGCELYSGTARNRLCRCASAVTAELRDRHTTRRRPSACAPAPRLAIRRLRRGRLGLSSRLRQEQLRPRRVLRFGAEICRRHDLDPGASAAGRRTDAGSAAPLDNMEQLRHRRHPSLRPSPRSTACRRRPGCGLCRSSSCRAGFP
jgi:hypothetical protein